MISISRPYPFKLFKGYLPQILLGPLLNTLPEMLLNVMYESPNIILIFFSHNLKFRYSFLNQIQDSSIEQQSKLFTKNISEITIENPT